MDIDEEWEHFLLDNEENEHDEQIHTHSNNYAREIYDVNHTNTTADTSTTIPKSTDLYISTQTKIIFLSTTINLNIFWEIPIIPYHKPIDGIIKKQMKIISLAQEDLENIQNKLKNENYFEEFIITHIDNKNGRIKFKDVRKISIGISKKDILNRRCKKKSAFYNCFVIIIRIKITDVFKEIHVKIFNTGKIEIPGIQSDMEYNIILDKIKEYLQPLINNKISFIQNSDETVLINSNFNCGYFINRTKLHDILKFKYNIQSIYEPCNYPGIQNKFYYNPNDKIQKGCQIVNDHDQLIPDIKSVSFMIFRTGSILIVGKCQKYVLTDIYNFLKEMFETEYHVISQKCSSSEVEQEVKIKTNKPRITKKCLHFVNCDGVAVTDTK